MTPNGLIQIVIYFLILLAVTKPAGQFTPAINFSETDDLPNYKDIQPRLAVS